MNLHERFGNGFMPDSLPNILLSLFFNSMPICIYFKGDPLINLRSKEQEAELVRQTLSALIAMRIRFPGKTEEEAEAVLDEVGTGFLLTFVFLFVYFCTFFNCDN